jgi:hypothetical protein
VIWLAARALARGRRSRRSRVRLWPGYLLAVLVTSGCAAATWRPLGYLVVAAWVVAALGLRLRPRRRRGRALGHEEER